MKIKFFNPKELERNIKATIQNSGKLGFTIEAAKKLSLSIDKSAEIGINEDDAEDSSLYLVINENKDGAFKISKAGEYYYINAKLLFDSLKLDYSNKYITYTISQELVEDKKIFKFTKSEKLRNQIIKTITNE